jgi:hypothetical protein
VFGYDTNGNMYFVAPAGSSLSSSGTIQLDECRLDLQRRDVRARAHRADGRQLESRSRHRHQRAGAYGCCDDPMSTRRQWVSATVLPNGQVLATGGSGPITS